MKSLGRAEDIKSSQKNLSRDEKHFLKIPDSKTPWYLLGIEYSEGFVHWYESNSMRQRVVCAGGPEGKGFAVEECPLCNHVMGLYQDAKAIEAEDEGLAKKLRAKARDLNAKAEFQFKAIRGNRTVVKTIDPKTKKAVKTVEADFDADYEDSIAEAGIISMSEAQFTGLTGMIGADTSPFIERGEDLGNRVLWTVKENRKGKTGGKYSAVVWSADEDESEMPDFDVPEEVLEIDLEESFEIDLDQVDKVYEMVSGNTSEDVDDDEEVETENVEDSTDEDDEPEDSDLDDIEDDDDEFDDEDEVLDEAIDEADAEVTQFEDDIPGEIEEEDLPPKRTKARGSSGKSQSTTSTKARASSSKRSTPTAVGAGKTKAKSKGSSKVRM